MSIGDNWIRRYPEIWLAGSLDAALTKALSSVGSSLDADSCKRRGDRCVVVSVAAMERLFLVEFWSSGVSMARGKSTDLHQLASAIDLWVLDRELRVSRLSSIFPWVVPNPCTTAFEEGRAVDWKWETIIMCGERWQELRTLINRAALEPPLRRLFPYTSLNTLCFSRCTGYPFTRDTPSITPIGGGQYVVSAQRRLVAGPQGQELQTMSPRISSK